MHQPLEFEMTERYIPFKEGELSRHTEPEIIESSGGGEPVAEELHEHKVAPHHSRWKQITARMVVSAWALSTMAGLHEEHADAAVPPAPAPEVQNLRRPEMPLTPTIYHAAPPMSNATMTAYDVEKTYTPLTGTETPHQPVTISQAPLESSEDEWEKAELVAGAVVGTTLLIGGAVALDEQRRRTIGGTLKKKFISFLTGTQPESTSQNTEQERTHVIEPAQNVNNMNGVLLNLDPRTAAAASAAFSPGERLEQKSGKQDNAARDILKRKVVRIEPESNTDVQSRLESFHTYQHRQLESQEKLTRWREEGSPKVLGYYTLLEQNLRDQYNVFALTHDAFQTTDKKKLTDKETAIGGYFVQKLGTYEQALSQADIDKNPSPEPEDMIKLEQGRADCLSYLESIRDGHVARAELFFSADINGMRREYTQLADNPTQIAHRTWIRNRALEAIDVMKLYDPNKAIEYQKEFSESPK